MQSRRPRVVTLARARTAISRHEARRIALAAQGLAERRPAARIDVRHFRRVVERVQLVQLDSVNVLARAHYLPFYSRLGPYPRAALDRWLWHSGELFEYWGHAASLIPTAQRHLLVHRMRSALERPRVDAYASEHAELIERVLEAVTLGGPIGAGELNVEAEGAPGRAGWWGWSDAKRAIEHLFTSGRVAVSHRVNFARRYDLPERVHPPELLERAAPAAEEARLELLALAAAALGVGTAHDLVDYYRLPLTASRALLPLLIERGDVVPVAVEGWREPAYLHRDAALPRRVEGGALLGPFDSLVWYRERAERLFDFHYRISIYVPAAERAQGYYVLPFLLDDRLVARVDLKAERRTTVLRVREAAIEQGADLERVARALHAELCTMARWLDLETLSLEAPGALGDALRLVSRQG